MSVLAPFALAFVAGIVSFTSPCCLPLMPGYVSYVSGVAGGGSTLTLISQALRTTADTARRQMSFASSTFGATARYLPARSGIRSR